jgi:UPF0176 protein
METELESKAISTAAVLNAAAYKFMPLDNLPARRERLKSRCVELGLRGTILLSPEGINLFLAGEEGAIEQLLDHLQADPAIGPLELKRSWSTKQPFRRMLVRLKREIIAFGVEGIDPARAPSPKLPPQELKRWLDEGRPVTLLDVRNDYEVRLGTFAGAEAIGVDHFRDFPAAADERLAPRRDEPIVMFCTGGIRCEKAGPYLEQLGFGEVYQLEGGILKYFEECGGEHYLGDCFVFDHRTALGPDLEPTGAVLCFACQMPLTVEEQQSLHYVPEASCPYCYQGE